MAAGGFSARRAVDVLESMTDFEIGLRNRTEGITWLVWGLALPGMFLTYAFLGPRMEASPPLMPLMMILWVPWVAVGSAATFAIWRSAGLAMHQDPAATRDSFRRSVLRALLVVVGAWILACVAGFFAGAFDWAPGEGGRLRAFFAAVPLLIIGTVTVLGGAVGGRGRALASEGRRTAFAMGAFVLAAAVAISFSGWYWNSVHAASAAVTAVAYLTGGFYRVARG